MRFDARVSTAMKALIDGLGRVRRGVRGSTLALTAILFVATGCGTFGPFAGGEPGPQAPSGEQVAKADQSRHGPSDREGGIGGTGIFGAVTDLGSIHVGGRRVQLPDGLAAASTLGPRPADRLQVGDAVAVVGVQTRSGLRAERVSLFLPLVGPVTGVSSIGGSIEVMGTTVVVPSDAPVVVEPVGGRGAGSPIALGEVAVGDMLAVSGLWRGPEVVATRITKLTSPKLASISGLPLGGARGVAIGGTRVSGRAIEEARFVTAFGRYVGDSLVAARLDERPLGVFDTPVQVLIVEGFLSRNPADPGFHLSGFGLPLDPDSPIERVVGRRTLYVGSFDGDFRVDLDAALPDRAVERRELLRP